MILCCNTVVVLLRAIELMILCCNSVVVLLRAIELMILCCSTHYKVKKFWTDQFFVLDILNRIWTLLNILSIDWKCTEQILIITEHYSKFWTDSEHSEHRLNIDWTDSEHYWTFWTDSFLIKFFIFSIKSIYFTSFS